MKSDKKDREYDYVCDECGNDIIFGEFAFEHTNVGAYPEEGRHMCVNCAKNILRVKDHELQ